MVVSSAQNIAQGATAGTRAPENNNTMDTQPQTGNANDGSFNPFAGRGMSIGGGNIEGPGQVFRNYDHLDKNRGNLNDETMEGVQDEETQQPVEDSPGMTNFASSQFYATDDKKKDDDDDDHVTEF